LHQDVHQGDDRVPWLERVGDVAADQDVGAEGARVLRREVPHHTTVDDRRIPEVDR